MPQDAFTISHLVAELRPLVVGAKITKINQPFADELLLQLYTRAGIKKLVVSANPNLNRLQLSGQSFPNPAQALPFQMTLRKHLSGGIVEDLVQDPFERTVRLKIAVKNELSDEENRSLVAELTGRTANLLLLDETETVIAALHTTGLEAERKILPGLPYEPLTQEKLRPDDVVAIRAALADFDGPLETFFKQRCKGLAKQTAAELAHRLAAGDSPEPSVVARSDRRAEPTAAASVRFPEQLDEQALRAFFARPAAPCVLYDGELAKDYFAFPYETCPGTLRAFPTLSAAMDAFYGERSLRKRFSERAQPLKSLLKGQITKQEKKLQKIAEKLLECRDKETFKIYGDLVIANLYRVQKGAGELSCDNYFEPDCPQIVIPLDARLTPAQNAQKYYKRYNKLKTAEEYATRQQAESTALLDYLQTVDYSFGVCTRFEEIEELAEELRGAGILRVRGKPKKKKQEEKISPFLYEYQGYRIAVGKNNVQNDVLSFQTARAGDVWLHAKDYHGCHTVVLNPSSAPVPDEVVTFAAELAAHYSQAAADAKVAVDYVDKKFLKKPPASPAGYVIYTNFKTVLVAPDAHEAFRKS